MNKFVNQRRIATQKLLGREWPQWLVLCGYVTNTMELAHVFGINPHTLRGRIKSGWPIEAALVANETEDRWDINTIDQLQKQKWVKPFIKNKLTEFFSEPTPVRKKRVYTKRTTK